MESATLIELSRIIEANIEQYGLARYDLRDTRWIPFLLDQGLFASTIRKTLLFVEEFFPIAIRRLLGCKPKVWPTTYSFLGNAYLVAEKYSIPLCSKHTSVDYADLCVRQYVSDRDVTEWWRDEPHIGLPSITIDVGEKTPTVMMHALARCNIFLLNVGLYHDKPDLVEIAAKSAEFVLRNYELIDFNDGTKSISYFYNSRDCTININSEYCHWLSLIPLELHSDKTLDMLQCTARLLVQEQNQDGSWYYFSRWHMKQYDEKPTCDSHHTATVLYNISNIIQCAYLDDSIKAKLRASLSRGMLYFAERFFDQTTGQAKVYVERSRPAGPVQYSEAIIAICSYLKLGQQADHAVGDILHELLPKIVSQNVSLVNRRNGSAPSEKVVKWLNLNSIRWGNGPILQAIMEYLAFSKPCESPL